MATLIVLGKEVTKSNLNEVAKELANKLGRTPKRREFEHYWKAHYRYGNWNNFLKAAGLKPLREGNLTLEDYEKIIHDFVRKHGRTPTSKDFYENLYLPDPRTMERKFGKPGSQILIDLGYEPNIRMNDFTNMTDEEILSIVKSELERIGSTTIVDYHNKRNDNAPSVRFLTDRLNMKWNEILKILGFEVNVEQRSKKEWLQLLRNIADDLGRTPSINDLADYGLNETTYKLNFGTWNNAIREAGLDINHEKMEVTHTDEELLQMYKDLCIRLGHAATGSEINYYLPYKEDVFATVSRVFERCQGGYAAVAMITGYGIVAFRDPNGIRPVVYGQRQTEQGVEYMVASESVALDVLGFSLIGDLAPGEALYITEQGELHTRQCAKAPKLSPCIFEYVYLARPDSILDGVSVYKARLRMGEKLAEKILRERPEHDIDVVIPIPDTSRTSALELANILGVKFREGFVKNRYIGRTFIMPGQAARKKSVRQKLNAIEQEFKDKNVMLVDDSIVRGTTCRQIIQMARDAGAKNVYFCSAAPAVRYPNVYGIDMPSVHELIAHNRTTEEVAELIGADWLLYQDLEDLKEAVGGGKVKIEQFDCAVFDGQYVTGDIDAEYLQRLEDTRNDLVKNGAQVANSIIELHNS